MVVDGHPSSLKETECTRKARNNSHHQNLRTKECELVGWVVILDGRRLIYHLHQPSHGRTPSPIPGTGAQQAIRGKKKEKRREDFINLSEQEALSDNLETHVRNLGILFPNGSSKERRTLKKAEKCLSMDRAMCGLRRSGWIGIRFARTTSRLQCASSAIRTS